MIDFIIKLIYDYYAFLAAHIKLLPDLNFSNIIIFIFLYSIYIFVCCVLSKIKEKEIQNYTTTPRIVIPIYVLFLLFITIVFLPFVVLILFFVLFYYSLWKIIFMSNKKEKLNNFFNRFKFEKPKKIVEENSFYEESEEYCKHCQHCSKKSAYR